MVVIFRPLYPSLNRLLSVPLRKCCHSAQDFLKQFSVQFSLEIQFWNVFNDRKRVVGFRFDVEMFIVWFSVWIGGLVCLVQKDVQKSTIFRLDLIEIDRP